MIKMHPQEKCAKCGSCSKNAANVGIKEYVPASTGVIKYRPEHLIMKCATCGFEFSRAPIDSKYPTIKDIEEAYEEAKYRNIEIQVKILKGEINGEG